MPPTAAGRQLLAILGTSLFAPEVADLAADTGEYELTTFVENWDRTKTERPFLGRPVIWIDDVSPLVPTHAAVCSLGTTHRRGFVEQAAAAGFRFARIIHPGARISTTSEVGDGSIVSAGVIIASHTTIGRHVIVNRGALIGHHAVIDDYVTIGPGANIAGATRIHERAYIGMGAIVVDRITIGAQAIVGAGAVVMRDVPDRVQVMGIPARPTRVDVDGR